MSINLDKIRNIPIEDFMINNGFEINNSTVSNFFFHSPFRNEKTASFSVWKKKNRWKDFGTGEGGDIIELAQKIWNTSFKEAIHRLDNNNYIGVSKTSFSTINTRVEKILTLKHYSPIIRNKALLDYVKSRKLDYSKVSAFIGEIYFYLVDKETGELVKHPKTSKPKEYFAIAFKNDLGGYEIRNKYFKKCYDNKAITTVKKGFDSITVFEGFIDFLSLFTSREIKSDILVLNGCSMVKRAIPVINSYKKSYLMLDRDKAGNETTKFIKDNATCKTVDCRNLYKGFKDINDWICAPTLSLKN